MSVRVRGWSAEQRKGEFSEHAISGIVVFREPAASSDNSKRVLVLYPNVPLSGRMLSDLRAAWLE